MYCIFVGFLKTLVLEIFKFMKGIWNRRHFAEGTNFILLKEINPTKTYQINGPKRHFTYSV